MQASAPDSAAPALAPMSDAENAQYQRALAPLSRAYDVLHQHALGLIESAQTHEELDAAREFYEHHRQQIDRQLVRTLFP